MIFLISCISVSILCNKSQIHGLTAINNAGISIFVERKWIALSKSIIFYICIFTILTVLSRICSNKKALVLLFVLLGYWVINAVDVYRKYDSLWLEISQESIDIYEKLEDYNHKNSKVYGYTPKSDIYLSQYPVNGVQFLADYPIQVITKWQDLQDLPENSLIVTIQDKMLDESTKYRNLFNNDKFYVYEKVG